MINWNALEDELDNDVEYFEKENKSYDYIEGYKTGYRVALDAAEEMERELLN